MGWFSEWRKRRRLRTCQACESMEDKSDMRHVLWGYLGKDFTHLQPRKNNEFVIALCVPCYTTNRQQFKQSVHEERVKERAYEMQVELEAKKLVQESTRK